MKLVSTGVEETEENTYNEWALDKVFVCVSQIKKEEAAQDGIFGKVSGFSYEKNQGTEANQVIFQAVANMWEILCDKINEKIALGVGRIVSEGGHNKNEAYLKNKQCGQNKSVNFDCH